MISNSADAKNFATELMLVLFETAVYAIMLWGIFLCAGSPLAYVS